MQSRQLTLSRLTQAITFPTQAAKSGTRAFGADTLGQQTLAALVATL